MLSHTDSGILDNRFCGTVGDFLQKRIVPGCALSFVSAYFTIYAYDRMRAQLDGIDRLRFLFGDPQFMDSLDPDKSETKHFAIEGAGLSLANMLSQKAVAQDCERWIYSKVDIRSLKGRNLLHGKMYLVDAGKAGVPAPAAATLFGDTPVNGLLFSPHSDGRSAVLGSSNFTVRGLGLGTSGNNLELNLIVQGEEDFTALTTWFEKVWADTDLTHDVKDKVLHYLRQLYVDRSPEFIYFKTLYHVFERQFREAENSGFAADTRKLTETGIWNALFGFQQDGVKGIINKINQHGGCILADSVGLGKTFEALAVIKHFEQKNARVLVLCPKKLSENWTVYTATAGNALNPFPQDRFGYTVLSHTDLNRESGKVGYVDLANFQWDAFDLVVIDESHNFRTETHGKNGTKSRYERLMDDVINAGAQTRVLLLSATPVNNDLKDLRSQIRLIAGGDDDAFRTSGGGNVKSVLQHAQKTFVEWANKRRADDKVSATDLLASLSSEFLGLLDMLTIARSRRHIETYYKAEMERIGAFPKREKPISLFPAVDLQNEFPDYDAINRRIVDYQLALFKPTAYLLPDFADTYRDTKVANFSQTLRETYLVGMMKVNFLKRLESSVHSFAETLERTVANIARLEEKIEAFQAGGGGEVDAATEAAQSLTDDDDEENEALTVGAAQIKLAHLDLDKWLRDLKSDRAKLETLAHDARRVTPARDAKLSELKRIISEKSTQPNRKVLVFTAFADTAKYLYHALRDWAKAQGIESALVTGSGGGHTTFGHGDFQEILTNFSPLSKNRVKIPRLPQIGQIDLLIATDCISEGQNLQDADLVVNYDIHWNPVRLIQRFGRIDRLGSKNDSITMINFWPTKDLDKYVNLKSRVEARMALVDVTATGYDGLLSPHELEKVEEGTLHYRDQQLLRLQDEILDLEDMSDSVTLSDFTLDDFRLDLLRFIEKNKGLLEDAPLGLYACVPFAPPAQLTLADVAPIPAGVSAPGVIFCLRQKNAIDGKASAAINPTAPYFLVYVRDDGIVRYNFANVKQILELFRLLCLNKPVAYEDLCRAFDAETDNGRNMGKYSGLLSKAIPALQMAAQKRETLGLFNGRGGGVGKASERIQGADDFDLVTWLVLK